MENKKAIPNNSIYTAVYKNGKVTNEYIPLLDIKLKGKVSLKDKLLEYENLFSELVAKNNYQQKEINKLTEALNQLINATTNSFKTVMDEMKKNEFL